MTPASPLISTAMLRRLAPGLVLIAAVLLLFRDTAAAMVGIWIRSETFAHAFLVPPIVVWLVWRRRALLATLQPRPAPWVLLPIAVVCFLWLLGELAGVNSATQFALVALLMLSVPAVFGLQVARALTFPLLFLLFAVPFGEFMVPTMMEWTADFTVAAVQLSGVPVYREGLQFIIPSGSWSVVEACSGVRYLIASFMVGTLFAYLNFRSPLRRTVFIAASLLVPIAANWLRAYLIVMVGHLSSNKLAAGVDHIIYGWVWFGLVIGAMFFVGARWSEPDEPVPAAGAARNGAAAGAPRSAWVVGLLMTALLVATQAAFWRLDHAAPRPAPVLALPADGGAGWRAADASVSDWEPAFKNARVTAQRSYGGGDDSVALWVGYYRDQGYDRKLVTSSNSMTEQVTDAPWSQVSGGSRSVATADGPLQVQTGVLRGAPLAASHGAQRLRAWQLYWIGGRFIAGDARARLQIAVNRLLGRGDDAAVVFFYTPLKSAADTAAEDARLQQFVGANLPAVAAALAAAQAPR